MIAVDPRHVRDLLSVDLISRLPFIGCAPSIKNRELLDPERLIPSSSIWASEAKSENRLDIKDDGSITPRKYMEPQNPSPPTAFSSKSGLSSGLVPE